MSEAPTNASTSSFDFDVAEVVAQLSDRGQVEWQLAIQKVFTLKQQARIDELNELVTALSKHANGPGRE